MTRRTLREYRTFRELLDEYAALCQPQEVAFRDAAGDYRPAEMLTTLSAGDLDAPIIGVAEFTKSPNEITLRFSDGSEPRYFVIWSPERYGWTVPPYGSRQVHFVVPWEWLKDVPFDARTMLVSLCRRQIMANEYPFWPVEDPKYCKTCTARYEDFLHARGLGG